MTVELRLATGRTVKIDQCEGHWSDKEIDFALDDEFVGGHSTHFDEALANAIRGVEHRLGEKVVEVNERGSWSPWPPKK